MKRTKIAGRLRVTRLSSNDPAYDEMISITIDARNPKRVIEIIIEPHAFGLALTGLGQDCIVEISEADQ